MNDVVIGIDIGGTNIRVALLNKQLEILKKETARSDQFTCKHAFLEQVANMVGIVNENRQANVIGIVLPIPWANNKLVFEDAINIPFLERLTLDELMAALPDYDIFVENDVNVVALLEANLGKASTYENSAYITVSTGIGSGIIINKEIYHGSNGYAGEVGSILIRHPQKGLVMLEELCSGTALSKESAKLYGAQAEAKELFVQYEAGDEMAKEVIADWIEQFSIGLATVMLMVDPSIIVLGGPVIINHPWLLEHLIIATKEKVLANLSKKVNMVISNYGVDAGLVGVGYYAWLKAKSK